jgi:hypothetical protein
MPENVKSAKLTLYASSSNSTVVALAKVGNGYSQTITNNPRKLQIRSCRCGLFHKVGRSKTTREHESANNSTVTLSKNITSLWALMRNSHQCTIRNLMELLKGQMG